MKIRQFCKICGCRFEVKKEDVYLAVDNQSFADKYFSKPHYMYDVIDCPVCGCQKMLQIRMEKYDGSK